MNILHTTELPRSSVTNSNNPQNVEEITVLLMHGLLGNGRNLLLLAKALQADCRVVLIDLVNHGQSFHRKTMSYPEMVEDVRAWIEQDQTKAGRQLRYVAIGHSMGGKVAMGLAAQGIKLEALVVLDMAPVRTQVANTSSFPVAHVVQVLARLELSKAQRREVVDQQLQQWISEPNIRAFVLANLVRNPAGFSWRINLPAIVSGLADVAAWPFELAQRSPQCKTLPVLALVGQNSSYVGPEEEKALCAWFPKCIVKKIPDSGHWLHAEQPQAVNHAVRQFLL